MSSRFTGAERALAELGITLAEPPATAGRYRPWIIDGTLLFVSGQISTGPAGDMVGVLGAGATLADGVAAARQCGLNLLSQIRQAAGGDLDRVHSILRLTGFVKVAPSFGDVAQVIDGCSALLADVLGPAAGHARSAVGVADLPRGCLVEVDAIVRLHSETSARGAQEPRQIEQVSP